MNEVLFVDGKAICDPLSERFYDIFLGMRHKRDIGKSAVIVCFMGKHWIQIREPYHGGEGMAETYTKRKGGDSQMGRAPRKGCNNNIPKREI